MANSGGPTNILILGAAGRDFHNFNCRYRDDARYRVVAFTATQIPNIERRTYPPELAGSMYPIGIPIYSESELTAIIDGLKVDSAVFSYSDVSNEYVMHMASRVNAAGADFALLGLRDTMLKSSKPVVAVCAVRTGSGKSQTTRYVAQILKTLGKKVAIVRHPMPYGDLKKQICQRFATLQDLDRHECTIEEREEYEHHLQSGNLVFAGIDYGQILAAAEREADVILWDGGNNDTPFFKPDLWIVVADPHRPGHELSYYPGGTNFRMADVILINKVNTARSEDVAIVESNAKRHNPAAALLRADSAISCSRVADIRGKRVIVVEDGPTVTHGGMGYGAAHIAARQFGAASIVDPRPYAFGSIREVYDKYSHLAEVLPAMGYGRSQMDDLQTTINSAPGDLVLIGTPVDLSRLMRLNKPSCMVRYELAGEGAVELTAILRAHPRLT